MSKTSLLALLSGEGTPKPAIWRAFGMRGHLRHVGAQLNEWRSAFRFQLKPVKKNDPNTPGKKYDDYWETSQKEILQDPKALLDRLFNFDKDNIPDRVIQAGGLSSTTVAAQAITPYMEREDFDPVAIKKVWHFECAAFTCRLLLHVKLFAYGSARCTSTTSLQRPFSPEWP